MIVVGIDPHFKTHTAVCVDGASGQLVDELAIKARKSGYEELLLWARKLAPERRFAVEDVRHCSASLERFLLARGEEVVRVPPKLMGQSRRQQREYGKSDPIDATAVARAALRETDLPRAQLAGPEREVKLLLDHREDLVQERTRVQCRLRLHLHDLDPEFEMPRHALRHKLWAGRVGRLLARHEQSTLVAICRELLRRNNELNRRIAALERELLALVRQQAPSLLKLEGCAAICAATIIAEVAGVGRFSSCAKLAMHAGVAPILASSGKVQRHRLNRSGNRRLNCACHRIAQVQVRDCEHAQAFMAKKQAEGKNRAEGLRCLKRHIARRVFRLLSAELEAQGPRAAQS